MRDSGSHLFFNGVGCEVLLKQRLLNPKESSFNVILLEKTDLSIAIEASQSS